jgi:hypothetical protein
MSIVVVMNVVIFLRVAPYSPYVKKRFGGTYHLHFRAENKPNKKSTDSEWLGNTLVIDPEDGSDTFPHSVGSHGDHTAQSQKTATFNLMLESQPLE